jgi:hypothetical protein
MSPVFSAVSMLAISTFVDLKNDDRISHRHSDAHDR